MIEIELPAIFLSFDDWWIAEWFAAIRFLAAYGIPATFYLAFRTNMQDNYWNAGRAEAFMTPDKWKMLNDLQAAGHVIGSHTISHVRVDSYIHQSKADFFLHEEIDGGLGLLESHGIKRPRHFAYPYGFHTYGTDDLLKTRFDTLRSVATDTYSGIYSAGDLATRRVFDAYDLIDTTLSVPAIKRVVAEKKAGFFFGHNPKDIWPKLISFVEYCKTNKAHLYPMSILDRA